jgi:hypothetical protein
VLAGPRVTAGENAIETVPVAITPWDITTAGAIISADFALQQVISVAAVAQSGATFFIGRHCCAFRRFRLPLLV